MPSSTTHSARTKRALTLAAEAHEGQVRKSGEPYVEHPKAVAKLLNMIHADEDTICAALLHDTLEDTALTKAMLQKLFGHTVAKLVEGVTKVGKVEKDLAPQQRNLESIRKMFRVMGRDLRVLFIKIADRLHNMETIGSLRRDKQQRIARETLDIYCPLANLLGLRDWYEKLHDLCLHVLHPQEYQRIERKRQQTEKRHRAHLLRWASRLGVFLEGNGFKSVAVTAATRHADGVYHSTQGQLALLEHIETFYRIHIIVPKAEDCYRVLGAVHQFAAVLPHRINDYVACPKTNGYRAIHTTVVSPLGNPIKILIRSEAMEREARYGSALPYQQRDYRPERAWRGLPIWLETIMSLERGQEDMTHFFQALRSEIFGERSRVHVIGAERNVIDVPHHASVLDVAFYTDQLLAKNATGAIVNRQQTNLRHLVNDGDVIEIIAIPRRLQRRASDLRFTYTSVAQKLLIDMLQKLPPKERQRRGREMLAHAIDMLLDPFFSMGWRSALAKQVLANRLVLEDIGAGLQSPYAILETNTQPSDFFLLSPRCFSYSTHMAPETKVRFVLHTSLEQLRSGKVIGQHVRPDVIDVHSLDGLPAETTDLQTKEIVSLQIRPGTILDTPFQFALQWSFTDGANPLAIIANLQSMLDTPLELLKFDNTSATLGFLTDRTGTLRIAYEYLIAHQDVTSVVRTTP